MKIIKSEAFIKDIKKLKKSFPSIESDLQVLEQVVKVEPLGNGSRHWNCLKRNDEQYIFKTRMACRSLKRGKDFRVTYFYDGNIVEIQYIELYFKGRKANENKKRIESLWNEKTTSNG